MTRPLFAAAALVAALSGCASPARIIDRTQDGGVVAIPSNTDFWPTYNRSAAIEKIKEHVGPNFDIIEEREVAKGQQTTSNQQVNGQGQSSITTTQDLKEYVLVYRRKAGMLSPLSPMNQQMGQFGGIQQTGLPGSPAAGLRPAGGIVPSAGPNGGVYQSGGVPGGAGMMGGGFRPMP